MPSDQIGLRHRVRRLVEQIARQHRQLGELRGRIDAAFARGAWQEAGRSLDQFRAVLVAHFDLEQDVFFPALHGLEPSRKRDLESLEQEHAELLAQLEGVVAGVEPELQPDCAERFRSCLERLRGHEKIEEELVGAISKDG
jgi:hypothetical protein